LIIVGVLIALMSLSIINLITSLTISSLNTDKTTKWCVFNNEILSSNNIKKEAEKYICSFNLWYKRDSDRISWNKCYKENTDKSECDQLWGNRGGGVWENSNNCYIEIRDIYLCDIFWWIYKN
jgi:hypothetical protein